VAILQEETDNRLLLAPYGRFSEPAIPGELLTGRTAPPLRVICPWNFLVTNRLRLEHSWLVSDMADTETAEALSVLAHTVDGIALPAALTERVGPPLRHPLDPRHDYIEEERTWTDQIGSRCADGGMVVRDGLVSWPQLAREPRPLRKAAETRAHYGSPPAAETEGREPS
jgi:hypothetical protein